MVEKNFLCHYFHSWQEWDFYKFKSDKFKSMFIRLYAPSKAKVE